MSTETTMQAIDRTMAKMQWLCMQRREAFVKRHDVTDVADRELAQVVQSFRDGIVVNPGDVAIIVRANTSNRIEISNALFRNPTWAKQILKMAWSLINRASKQ